MFETVAGDTPALIATSRIVGTREGLFGGLRSFISANYPIVDLRELAFPAIQLDGLATFPTKPLGFGGANAGFLSLGGGDNPIKPF